MDKINKIYDDWLHRKYMENSPEEVRIREAIRVAFEQGKKEAEQDFLKMMIEIENKLETEAGNGQKDWCDSFKDIRIFIKKLKSTIKQAEHPFKQIENISYPNDVINAREI